MVPIDPCVQILPSATNIGGHWCRSAPVVTNDNRAIGVFGVNRYQWSPVTTIADQWSHRLSEEDLRTHAISYTPMRAFGYLSLAAEATLGHHVGGHRRTLVTIRYRLVSYTSVVRRPLVTADGRSPNARTFGIYMLLGVRSTRGQSRIAKTVRQLTCSY